MLIIKIKDLMNCRDDRDGARFSQYEKEFVYKELNIFRQTMPSSGVTWNS
jgi:hypothetical protein